MIRGPAQSRFVHTLFSCSPTESDSGLLPSNVNKLLGLNILLTTVLQNVCTSNLMTSLMYVSPSFSACSWLQLPRSTIVALLICPDAHGAAGLCRAVSYILVLVGYDPPPCMHCA